jgi:phosphoglycolate phosphatase
MTHVVLFDIDGTLITTGGAGSVAWKRAFDDLYGIPADIGEFTDNGMTDPDVGRRTFEAVIGREPTPVELTRLMAKRLEHLPAAVGESSGYRVLPGVEELLPRLAGDDCFLGLTTGGTDSAAHIKLAHANLARWFSFGGYGSDSTDRAELTATAIVRAEALLGSALPRQRVLVVGDTPLDVAAAKAVGAVSVAVATGRYAVDALAMTGADHVLASLKEGLPL